MNLDTIIQDLDIETDPVESDTVESDNANWVDKQNSLNIPQHISNISEIEQNSVLSEEQYNSRLQKAIKKLSETKKEKDEILKMIKENVAFKMFTISLLSNDDVYNCILNNDNPRECVNNFIDENPENFLLLIASISENDVINKETVSKKMSSLEFKRMLKRICQFDVNKNKCNDFFTQNIYGNNFIKNISIDELKCIRNARNISDLDKKCGINAIRYLIMMPEKYSSEFSNQEYIKLAKKYFNKKCSIRNPLKVCNEMLNKLESKNPLKLSEMSIFMNPDYQEYCDSNNIKLNNCVSKYLKHNPNVLEEYTNSYINYVNEKIEEYKLNGNIYYDHLDSSKKSKVNNVVNKMCRSLLLKKSIKGLGQLEKVLIENPNVFRLRQLLCFNSMIYDYNNDDEKKKAISLFMYPKFEECMSNNELSFCSNKHEAAAKHNFDTIHNINQRAEMQEQELNSPQVIEGMLSVNETEEFTDYKIKFGDKDFLKKINSTEAHVIDDISLRLKKTCKKVINNIGQKFDINVSECVSYIVSEHALKQIFIKLLNDSNTYKCMLDSKNERSLDDCLYRYFVDNPDVLKKVNEIREMPVSKKGYLIRSLMESLYIKNPTIRNQNQNQNQNQNPMVELAQPLYKAYFPNFNDPYDLSDITKLERPIHDSEFPNKFEWGPKNDIVDQRQRRHLNPVVASNTKI